MHDRNLGVREICIRRIDPQDRAPAESRIEGKLENIRNDG
jgi:hypothetical protein